MIITHTQNANGERRIYLGGKSSLEAYITPKADSIGWTFHIDNAVTGSQLTEAETRTSAIHTLMNLAEMLNVRPDQLAVTSFEAIAALHGNDPYTGRRIANGRAKRVEHGYMSTAPGITRPQANIPTHNYASQRRHR